MKIPLLYLLLLAACASRAQESDTLPTDLLYSPGTMTRLAATLRAMEGELNGPPPKYWSEKQGRGTYVFLDTLAEPALAFLRTGPRLDVFLRKFPMARTERNTLVVAGKEGQGVGAPYGLLMFPSRNSVAAPHTEQPVANAAPARWVYHYYDRRDFNRQSTLSLVYLEAPLESKPVPEQYARLLRYADHMLDSTPIDYPQKFMISALDFGRVGEHEFFISVCKEAAEKNAVQRLLRAHLNLLLWSSRRPGRWTGNDPGTYVRELDELGLDVPALLLGRSLRASDRAFRHDQYSADPTGDLIGRSLAASRHRAAAQGLLEQAVADPDLDEYNRLICSNIYTSVLRN